LWENTDATEDMKRILMMSVGSKWREWKHEAKNNGYDSYTNDVERLANRPDRVEEDQWRALVHYWSSTDAKVFSHHQSSSDMTWSLDYSLMGRVISNFFRKRVRGTKKVGRS